MIPLHSYQRGHLHCADAEFVYLDTELEPLLMYHRLFSRLLDFCPLGRISQVSSYLPLYSLNMPLLATLANDNRQVSMLHSIEDPRFGNVNLLSSSLRLYRMPLCQRTVLS